MVLYMKTFFIKISTPIEFEKNSKYEKNSKN